MVEPALVLITLAFIFGGISYLMVGTWILGILVLLLLVLAIYFWANATSDPYPHEELK